jgi:hypothetical protein
MGRVARTLSLVGRRLSAHAGALGKALLAEPKGLQWSPLGGPPDEVWGRLRTTPEGRTGVRGLAPHSS